jgi:hypothetical protein
MGIFNFLMRKLYDEVDDLKANFLFMLFAAAVTCTMKLLMPKRFKQYFDDKNKRVKAEIGPPKFRVDMEVNVLTRSMVDERFIIKVAYLNNAQKIYVYDLEDIKDGTEYANVPEKFLCPLKPHALASNNVSFSELMNTLTDGKKAHHDIAW